MRTHAVLAGGVALLLAVFVWVRFDRRERAAELVTDVPASAREAELQGEPVQELALAVHAEEREPRESQPPPGAAAAPLAREPSLGEQCEIRGRFVFPSAAPAVDVPFQVHGWQSNDEAVEKYGLPEHWEDKSGATDADGRISVRFEPPRAFQFALEAKLPGYAGAEWRWSEIRAGSTVDLGELELVRGGTVEGRLVDADGEVVLGEHWMVYARSLGLRELDGRDETQVVTFADSATGLFRAEDVMPGRVELSANATDWTETTVVQVESRETTEADIVTERREETARITLQAAWKRLDMVTPAAEHVAATGPDGVRRAPQPTRFSFFWFTFDDLAPGEYALAVDDPRFRPWNGVARAGTTVEAALEGTAALELVAQGTDGAPIDSYGVTVELRNVDFRPNDFEVSAAELILSKGLVDGLVAGDYRVTARANQQLGVTEVQGLAGGETRRVVVQVGAEAVVAGRALFSDGRPASEIEVALLSEVAKGKPGSVESLELADRVLFEEGVETVETESDGSFLFTVVRSGKYIVRAATSFAAEAVSESFELGPGTRRTDLELVLPRGGHLSGRIIAAANTSCAGLRMWAGAQPDTFGRLHQPLPIDADGRFAFGPIAPGSATVYLLLPEQVQRMRGGFFMSGGATNGIPLGTVEIVDGGRVERDFEVAAFPGTIALDVLVNGDAVAGVSLALSMQEVDQTFQLFGETDAGGRFGPALAFAGSWTLTARDQESGWTFSHAVPLFVTAASESFAQILIQVSEASLVFLDATSGAPLTKRFISVLSPGRQRTYAPLHRLKTDEQGRASLRLTSGDYRLRLDRSEDVTLEFESDETPSTDARIVPLLWTVEGPLAREIRL